MDVVEVRWNHVNIRHTAAMTAIRVAIIGALLGGTLLVGAAACGGDIDTAPLPDGVVAHIDQSRVERKGREVFLRVENGTTHAITIETFRLTSPRFATVDWAGDETIGPSYEADLEFNLPRGRCGSKIDARVTFTYRIGDGELRESTMSADDPYGNAALFADRDCAESTLTEAADVEVMEPSVVGEGPDSVLQLPITLTPTGTAAGIRFGGFGSTVLFAQTGDSPTSVDVPLDAGDPPTEQVMSVVPARCDPHALAEDKVGTLFPVTVKAPDLPEGASFFLPLTARQRSIFFTFFRTHCGLG
jgi:hypothetical protein